MSWDIFSKSKIQYFLEKLKGKFVQKETGKGLSTNDFDNTYKSKVDKIDGSLTSVSGNLISISGLKSNQLAINPIITLEPIQAGSGAPSPSNIRAISGYDTIEVLSCGKNLLQKPFVYYDDITRNKANSFLIGAGTYIFSFATTTATTWRFCVSMFDEDGNALTDTTYCPNSDMQYNSGYGGWINKGNRTYKEITLSIVVQCYIRITFCVGDTSSSTTMTNAQLELGSSATTYESCNKITSISESLGQTVYGGSLDVRTGVLTVTKKIVDLGDLDYTRASSSGVASFRASVTGKAYNNFNMLCDTYSIGENTSFGTLVNYELKPSSSSDMIAIRNDDYSDADVFATAMSGHYLVFELATPFTIQLTPHEISLLKDYAYVSTNGTQIQLSYHNGEMASLADVSQLGETVNELGNKTSIGKNLYSTTFTSDNTVTLNDSINNYSYIGIATGDVSDSSSKRGFIFVPADALSRSPILADFVNSYVRINASDNSLRFIGAYDTNLTAVTRYIHKIYGYK